MTKQLDHEFFVDAGRRGGLKSASVRYQSLLIPGLISTAAGIHKAHLSRGLDPKAKVRVETIKSDGDHP